MFSCSHFIIFLAPEARWHRARGRTLRMSITIVGTGARRNSCGLFVSVVPDQRFSTTWDESSSVQHVQLKNNPQNLDFQQLCRGPFASTKHLVWTFLKLSLRMVPKSFCATWCVGARCTNCAFLFWTSKNSGTVAKCIAERWIKHLGRPMLIIADEGKEFVGSQFKEFTNANSGLLHIIDVKAPWQNGRTGRRGDIYKKIFERARWMHSPSGLVAHQHLVLECNAAENRLSKRSSYFPFPASVRDWTPSSRGLDQWRRLRAWSCLWPCSDGFKFWGLTHLNCTRKTQTNYETGNDYFCNDYNELSAPPQSHRTNSQHCINTCCYSGTSVVLLPCRSRYGNSLITPILGRVSFCHRRHAFDITIGAVRRTRLHERSIQFTVALQPPMSTAHVSALGPPSTRVSTTRSNTFVLDSMTPCRNSLCFFRWRLTTRLATSPLDNSSSIRTGMTKLVSVSTPFLDSYHFMKSVVARQSFAAAFVIRVAIATHELHPIGGRSGVCIKREVIRTKSTIFVPRSASLCSPPRFLHTTVAATVTVPSDAPGRLHALWPLSVQLTRPSHTPLWATSPKSM